MFSQEDLLNHGFVLKFLGLCIGRGNYDVRIFVGKLVSSNLLTDYN